MKSFIENITKNLDDESKKRVKVFGIGFIAIVILIIIIAVVVAIINRKTSYEKMEEIMESAAYKYYQDNPDMLPNSNIKKTVVSAETLVESEYMKEISKYTKDESCTGNVEVTYNDSDYNYQAFLMCNNFETKLLVDAIKENNNIVTSGAGLYNEGEVLRFRGEYLSNYIKFKEELYRIIKIDNENKIYITPDYMDPNDDSTYLYWDDRYNSQEDSYCGINDYSLSRVRTSLDEIYKKLDDTLRKNTTTFNACVGKRFDMDSNNGADCSNILNNVNISLIPIYEYIRASIAPACNSPLSKECSNYNYLFDDEYSWWTLTADAATTSEIYYITYRGEIEKDKGYNKKVARYVIALNSNVVLNSGNGSENNPYQIR